MSKTKSKVATLDGQKEDDTQMEITEEEDYSGKKKIKENFASETQDAIMQAKRLEDSGKRDEAIETLLRMEKKARLGNDPKSVMDCARIILRICNDAPDFNKLNHYIVALCRRRGQFEGVQSDLITFAAGLAKSDKFKGDDKERENFISTLRDVSSGKMRVEVTRAELTQLLAKMKESEGKKEEASKIIQEEAVETFSTMSIQKKLEYLLEQFRLCLEVNDYVRALIIARKVDRAKLDRFEDLKVKFFQLLIIYYTHERNALEMARAHLQIYKTPGYQGNDKLWAHELKQIVVLLAISPYDNHQIDLVHNILADPNMSQIPEYKAFLTHFVTDELAQWPLPEHELIVQNELLKAGEAAAKNKNETTEVSDAETWYYKMLRDRVVEHDIRVVAKYYTRINTVRLAEFLQLSVDKTEDYLSSMVTTQTSERLAARIDRPAGIITFQLRKDPNEILTDWTENISELLNLVEKTCHLIHKENMLYQIEENK